jgi:arylsulfatase A-like enzyme
MKCIVRYLFTLLYIGVAIVCILMVIKPGAAFFYDGQNLNNQGIEADAGLAYRYKLNTNDVYYRPFSTFLYEDGQMLSRVKDTVVVESGSGAYSVSQSLDGNFYLFFSASDNSDPITNGRSYKVYVPFSFVNRKAGITYLLILLPGILWLAVYTVGSRERRLILLDSPRGVFKTLDLFFEHVEAKIHERLADTKKQVKTSPRIWRDLFVFTILTGYFDILMEWVFIVTMPSFMSIISLGSKLEVFLLSGLVVSILSMVAIIVSIGLDILGMFFNLSKNTLYIGLVIPAMILSSLALLLIDNFTYTVFKFGISTSVGVWRAIYTVIFLLIFIYICYRLHLYLGLRRELPKGHAFNRTGYLAVGLLVVSIGIALTQLDYGKFTSNNGRREMPQGGRRPNIILLGSDGLSAAHISTYGYERDTTPQLSELAQSSLMAENAFSNAANSPGSVISIFTGKFPTTTGVEFTPDILKGIDAFQHLPGIFKNIGYKTIELGMPLYVDSYAFNMQNGFDMVNGRTQESNPVSNLIQTLGYENTAYFINRSFERISDRLLHIFFIRQMTNPYIQVTQPADKLSDQEKIDQAMVLFDNARQPIFIHLHLLGTHGDFFELTSQVFSKNEEQSQPWMTDYYDDAILGFDGYIGQVIDHLKAMGQFDNTILIIYTDHAMQWRVDERIPLVIRFPNGEYASKLTQNVQNLDIAPTVLDYLGQLKPDWMTGESLLNGNLDEHRLILATFAGGLDFNEDNVWELMDYTYKPPFYQFSYINVIDCQKNYRLNLQSLNWTTTDISDYPTPCQQGSLHSFEDIKQVVASQLAKDGFDISSLPR